MKSHRKKLHFNKKTRRAYGELGGMRDKRVLVEIIGEIKEDYCHAKTND